MIRIRNWATILNVAISCITFSHMDSLAEWEDPTNAFFEAAYFGDAAELKRILDVDKNPDTKYHLQPVQKKGALKYAVINKKYDVIDILVAYDYPGKWDIDFPKLFGEAFLDQEATRRMITVVPDFKTRYASSALYNAIKRGDMKIISCLMESGIDLNNKECPALLAALHTRNTTMIRYLMNQGADPYLQWQNGMPLIEQAVLTKSTELLRLLDRDRKYSHIIKKIESEFPPPNKPTIEGSWCYLKEGFGSMLITFYEDATCICYTDVGGMHGVWKISDDTIQILFINSEGKIDTKHPMLLKVRGTPGYLEYIQKDQGKPLRLGKFEKTERLSEMRYPPFIRIQKTYITSTNVILQINNRYVTLLIDNLLKAQKEIRGAPCQDNIISWDECVPGDIPTSLLKNAIEVPYVKKYASPGYGDWKTVKHDFNTLANVREEYSHTLFPSSSERFHNENVEGYVLLSNTNFADGKNWLMFYFLRSKENKQL